MANPLLALDTLAVGPTLAVFGLPGGTEWIIILVIGLLLFGRRLPEVGRSLGQGIVEFKKGLKGVSDEVENAGGTARSPQQLADQSPRDPARRVEESRADAKKSY
jgi:sec-independent protein translocase protein TatA